MWNPALCMVVSPLALVPSFKSVIHSSWMSQLCCGLSCKLFLLNQVQHTRWQNKYSNAVSVPSRQVVIPLPVVIRSRNLLFIALLALPSQIPSSSLLDVLGLVLILRTPLETLTRDTFLREFQTPRFEGRVSCSESLPVLCLPISMRSLVLVCTRRDMHILGP